MQDYSLGPVYNPIKDRRDYPLLRHVVQDLHPAGWALEFGVANGTSLAIIAEHMPVVGFDSFEGLPEDWRDYPKGSFAPTHPLTGWDTGLPPDIPNSRLVIGLFADTLPGFDFTTVQPLGLVHCDADLYSSTKTVLDHVGPHLTPGCFVVFDEFWGLDGKEIDEGRAWREFAEHAAITWTVIGNSVRPWAIQITA